MYIAKPWKIRRAYNKLAEKETFGNYQKIIIKK